MSLPGTSIAGTFQPSRSRYQQHRKRNCRFWALTSTDTCKCCDFKAGLSMLEMCLKQFDISCH